MSNFVKLNGYDVEDSGARASIETINDGFSYSTDEVETGKTWIDGKKIYRKVIHFGTFPTGASKQVNHEIHYIHTVTDIRCIAQHQIDPAFTVSYYEICPQYFVYTSDMSDLTFFNVYRDGAYVNVDRNPYDSEVDPHIIDSYIILEYTKIDS